MGDFIFAASDMVCLDQHKENLTKVNLISGKSLLKARIEGIFYTCFNFLKKFQVNLSDLHFF